MIKKQYLKIILPLALVILAGLWVAAFSLDSAFAADDSAVRNIKLGSYEVGGMERQELEDLLLEISEAEAKRQVTLFLPVGDSASSHPPTITTTLENLGIGVDATATIERILEENRRGGFFNHLISWSGAFFKSRQISIQYKIQGPVQIEAIPSLPVNLSEPISANFIQDSPRHPLALVEEQLGQSIDAASIGFGARALVNHGIPFNEALGIQLAPSTLYPEIRNYAIRSGIRKISELTDVGLDVLLGAEVRRLSPEAYREAFEFLANPQTGQLEAIIAANALQKNVEALYSDYLLQESEIVYSISESGVPVPALRGENLGCCAPITPRQIDNLLEGDKILEIKNKAVTNQSLEEHRALQIQEVVSEAVVEFTPRTTRAANLNIAAEKLRGAVIFPNDRWSLSVHLGMPSREDGYLPAGFVDSIFAPSTLGGGVDILATALFEAAFLAGMDLPIYEPQPIFVQGNPYGLSISYSWPSPNLIIGNPTPYGVLIWTEQAEDSIKVKLYSTKYFEEVSSEQFIDRIDRCSQVLTERTRKAPEEEEAVVDVFRSLYFPDYGVRCDGSLFGSERG